MRRGAMVKALAVCSPNPYIQIYKVGPFLLEVIKALIPQPLLLLAMEEYFVTGSVDTLAKLYDCTNAISTYGMPRFTRSEKILLRQSEQRDVLAERYLEATGVQSSSNQELSEDLEEKGSASSHQIRGSSKSSRDSHHTAESITRDLTQTSSQAHAPSPIPKDPRKRPRVPRDTHIFETEAQFAHVTVPIRIPMTVFDEDVGDVSCV